jgi:Fe-S cluster assembly scaffold protein SufB
MSTGTEQGGATGGAMTGEEKMITGEVKNVNKDQKQITITGPEGNQVVYTLSNDTQITTRTGETMKIGDLKSGSKVTITYTGTGESAQVKKVEVQQGK